MSFEHSPTLPASAGNAADGLLVRGGTLGRYVILDEIGRGGMGVVYAAYDPELDRRVAIKLLHPEKAGSGGEARRGRLVREAQAMARLSHPNVIAVHDVGTRGDDVFVAMDFVDGATLSAWLAEKTRAWGEVLAVFVAAGRGLAAAHDAGLVHRDFKPENVLIRRDGHVLVTDFGLARSTRSAAAQPASGEPASPLSASLTRTGTIMGTPAYMSPEQHRGELADARSDQFSFCVALYEALNRRHPFSSVTGGELSPHDALALEVLAGRIQPPPRNDVPTWLNAAVTRGLARSVGGRYPSMHELLAALHADSGRARRRWIAVGVVAVLVAGGAALVARGAMRRGEACAGAGGQVAAVWNDARRSAVRGAFLATGAPYAGAAVAAVERRLDAYAAELSGMIADNCRATRLRRDQSEDLMDRRAACLSSRLKDLTAMVDLFAQADREVVEHAPTAAGGLAEVSSCDDLAALRAQVPPPRDAETRTRVEAVYGRLGEVRALRMAGKYAQGLAPAAALVDDARRIDYAPLLGEALLELGQQQLKNGKYGPAMETYREADLVAERGASDLTRAWAYAQMAYIAGHTGRAEEGRAWGRQSLAVIARMGGNDRLEAVVRLALGSVESQDGRFARAEEELSRAVVLLERGHGAADELHLVPVLLKLGQTYLKEGKFPEAEQTLLRALALAERMLGTEHPSYAQASNNLGMMYLEHGDYARAEPRLHTALAVEEKSLGPDHPDLADVHNNLGLVYQGLGRYPEAVTAFEHAAAVWSKAYGANNPYVAVALDNLGAAYRQVNQPERALATARRALAIRVESQRPDHPSIATSETNVGEILRLAGQRDEALVHLEHAREIFAKLGPDYFELAWPLTSIGLIYLDTGRAKEALPLLEQAWTLRVKSDQDPANLADVRFALARAVEATGGDHARARTLAEQALADYGKAGPSHAEDATAVSTWLAKH